jgi:hypothetical protein
VHAFAAVHDTPDRSKTPTGLGIVCTVQLVPFQRSASAPPLVPAEEPIAVHAFADVHDTPNRELAGAVGGTEVVWIQLVPFHASANIT